MFRYVVRLTLDLRFKGGCFGHFRWPCRASGMLVLVIQNQEVILAPQSRGTLGYACGFRDRRSTLDDGRRSAPELGVQISHSTLELGVQIS